MSKGLSSSVIANSAKWSSITEFSTRLVSPLTNMVLARLLAPEAFGVVATITLVVSFTELFTDAGFQKYLVQHEFENEDDLLKSTNVAFWTNLVLSVFLWVLITTFSDSLAILIGSAGKGDAVAIAALSVPLLAFSSIQTALYRRRFDFKTLFKVRLITALVPMLVTVPLAFIFKSYWALIIGTLMRDAINAFVLTLKSPWKPKWYYNVFRLKVMLSFTIWTMLEQISIWLTSNMDVFIVSRFLTEHYMGLYKTSMTTVGSYMGIITAATTPVLFSALSRYQNNERDFQATFYKLQRLVAFLIVPMGAGLYLYKELATEILLGNQWGEAAGFIGIWALTSAIAIIFSHFNSEVFRSKGKPKLSMLLQIIHLFFLAIVLLLAAPYGFRVLYIARSLARFQLIIASLIVLWVYFKISTVSIVKNVFPSIIATLAMVGVGIGLKQVSDEVGWTLLSVLICTIAYFSVLLLFPNVRKEVVGSRVGSLLSVKLRRNAGERKREL